jgi:ATPase family associated with various cellular activities (AAA)
MSDAASWQASNSQYLAMALAWLRGKLERRAGQYPQPSAIPAPEPPRAQASTPAAPEPRPESASLWRRMRRDPAPSAIPTAALPSPTPQPAKLLSSAASSAAGPDTEARLASELPDAESQAQAPPALTILARRLGLAPFERDILLLCAAMELDTGIASLCARAQGEPMRPYPTFALALSLFDASAWDALSPERPLRYWRLIEINQPAGMPLTSSPLRADERIVSYLKGLNYLDDRLGPLLGSLEVGPAAAQLPASQQSVADSISDRLKQLTGGENLPIVQLLGIDAPSKQLVAARAAEALGRHVYRLPAALVPTQAAELETLARLWHRESLLLPLALYLDGATSESDAPQLASNSPVLRLLSRTAGVIFVDTREPMPGLPENSLRVDVAKPTHAEQKEAWSAVLGAAAGQSPALLAAQFNLSLGTIHEIAGRVVPATAAADSSLHDRLWSACLASARPRLDALAQHVDAKATWEDIVLPLAETAVLHQIAAQVAQRSTVHESWGFARKMIRGLGISALFAGDSGTGKTMAAEVIANDLRLNLYRIDLSAVVSKYIGETEKNLRRLFDAAEDGGAILFFDEADALFGKRSEVKDSHDRYANIEINYLLQRMEAYGGLAILATNRQSALDQAFMRRLRFVVNFPFPNVAQRKAIWEKVFPPETPTKDLDLYRLSRLNLTGGNISSIALNAAFHAAQAGGQVTMPLILDSARAELRKLGRVINELEFRSLGKVGRVA